MEDIHMEDMGRHGRHGRQGRQQLKRKKGRRGHEYWSDGYGGTSDEVSLLGPSDEEAETLLKHTMVCHFSAICWQYAGYLFAVTAMYTTTSFSNKDDF
jgi:hypothetical protein